MKKLLRNVTLLCAAAATPFASASVDGGISIPAFGTVYGETGQEFGFYITVTNKCDEPLTSITYKVVQADLLASTAAINAIDDTDLPEQTVDLSAKPLAVGAATPLQFTAVAPATDDVSNKMQIRVKALNGQPYSKSASGKVTSVAFRPEVRSCVEDYTGLWCGWCPRGYVTMEMLNRDYPNKALTIAYHNSDIMATGKFTVPYAISGYPTITFNRASIGDPNKNYTDLTKINDRILLATNSYVLGVTMKDSYWSDADHTNAIGVAEIELVNDVTAGEYKVEFVLIEDGLKDPKNGEDAKTAGNWKQHNYYSDYSAHWSDPLWDLFANKEEYIGGLTFNDVCLMNSLKTPNGLVAAIPATEGGTKLTYTMTFPNVNNIVKSSTNLLMNPDKCRIACIVTKGGSFVNCHWMNVANESAGVNTVAADAAIDLNAPKEYFTISGQKVNADNLTPGLYIVRQGNHASKVVIR